MWTFIQEQILGMKWLSSLIGKLLVDLGFDITGKIGGSIHFIFFGWDFPLQDLFKTVKG